MIYQVGRFYNVLHVRTKWPDEYDNRKPHWVPVIGPAHNDIEVIGFEPEHWHVDFRFLDARTKRRAAAKDIEGAEVYSLPVSAIWPEDYDSTSRHRSGYITVSSIPSADPVIDSSRYLRVKRSRCKADYPGSPFTLPWLRELERAYADTRLKAGLICPHKGADLSTFEPDERDCVTCPLHGLTWNVRTGELVPAPLTTTEIKKERIYGTVLHN